MEDAGQKLKRVRERLNLRYRDVEEASNYLAQLNANEEFSIALSRLSDIENRGTVPSIFRIYSLCAIYRLDFHEVLEWYGIKLTALPSDSARIELEKTHPINFQSDVSGEVLLPLSLDPGIDLRRTTYLSRMIQRWGKLPLMLLNGLDLKQHRYAYLGTEDWAMYPVLHPGSLVLVDEGKRKIVKDGWTSEYDRPIYFVESRDGYACGYCSLIEDQLVLQPHSSSSVVPRVFQYPAEVDIIGQVTGVAMRLDPPKRRRTRS